MEGICRRACLSSQAPVWPRGCSMCCGGSSQHVWEEPANAHGWHLLPPLSSFVLLPPRSGRTLNLHSFPFSCWKLLAYAQGEALWGEDSCLAARTVGACSTSETAEHRADLNPRDKYYFNVSRRQRVKQTKAALLPHLMKSIVLKIPTLSAVDDKNWTADMHKLPPPPLPRSCRCPDKLCRSHSKPDDICLYFEHIFVISLITKIMWATTKENLL